MKKDISHLAEEISNVVAQISNGSATLEDLEAFAAATAELHERAVIIRYKSYEAKVFGTPVEPVQDFDSKPSAAVVEEVSSAIVPEEPEAVFTEEHAEILQETAEPEMTFDLFEEPAIAEEKEESFDLFSLDDPEEETSSPSAPAERSLFETQDTVSDYQSIDAPQAEEETPAFSREMAEENFFQPDETNEPTHLFEQETPRFIHPEIEPVRSVFSNDTPAYQEEAKPTEAAVGEPVIEAVSNEEEKPASILDEPAEAEIQEVESIHFAGTAPFHPEPEPVTSNTNIHPVYNRLSADDNSLAGRLMAVRLESLKGAFGLNERMQIIQELFQGSNDTFSQAIEKLDNLHSKGEARSVVSGYADRFDWKADSQLVLDFVQKVERRYA